MSLLFRQMECETYDLRTGDYEVQCHYEGIRKPRLDKIAIYLRCNDATVTANCNVGDCERNVCPDKFFITPSFYGRNSAVLLPLVSQYGRLRKVRKKAVRIVIVSCINSRVDGDFDKTGLPDPFVMTLYFVVSGSKIERLAFRLPEE